MSYGYSPVIPLQRNAEDGFYVLTKTIAQNIQQNFKNLLLTSPGERVMIPDLELVCALTCLKIYLLRYKAI